MEAWDTYVSRMATHGVTKRDASLIRERRHLNNKLPDSLSYHPIIIDGADRKMAVIDSDDFDIKHLRSMPGEDIRFGAYAEYFNQKWIVIEKDYSNELYTKAKMRQCNYLLKWVAEDETIQERWCIIDDGTKALTGEYSDRQYIVTRGDSRLALTIPKDNYTSKLDRNVRFIIDADDTDDHMAFRLTKPIRVGATFGDDGIYAFELTECNTEDGDNFELRIANYYDHFPKPNADNTTITTDTHGKTGWL